MAALLLCAVALSACGTPDRGPGYKHVVPTLYRTEIGIALTKKLDFPSRIRDASITDPMRNGEGPYFVCLRYTPRVTETTYAGRQEEVAYFFDGQLNQLIDATPEVCGKAVYKPYPELEKLCLADKCE